MLHLLLVSATKEQRIKCRDVKNAYSQGKKQNRDVDIDLPAAGQEAGCQLLKGAADLK